MRICSLFRPPFSAPFREVITLDQRNMILQEASFEGTRARSDGPFRLILGKILVGSFHCNIHQ